MDGYTLNAARTIREYESSIQRPKAERTINDSILTALLRGDELPEMDVKAIRQYGIQCSEYLDFGYDVDASLSGMLSPHAVLEPRPNTPYVFRRAGFDNLPFIYTQRHLRNAIAPKEADSHQHGLTIEQIKALPEKLEEPVVVFDQPNYTVNGRSFEGKGVAAVLDMYDPDGVPVIAYFFPNGYGTKTNDNGCSNVIASLYGRDNFTSYLARAANEEKILYIEAAGKNLTIYEESNVINTSGIRLKELIAQLPPNFIQSHRSFIVNSDYVNSYDPTNVLLYLGNHNISTPVGRKYKDYVKKIISRD